MSDLEDILGDKRISFFVAETYPSFAGGGLNAFSMARFLARKGADTSVTCLNYNNTLIGKENRFGVQINRICYFNKNILTKLFSFPNLLYHYSTRVCKSDIVFIYGCYMPGYLWIILLAWFFGKCVVFRSTLLGDDDMTSLKQKPFWKIKRYLFGRITLYFAINEKFKTIWEKEVGYHPPIFMSQQGIDSSIFNSILRENSLFNKNKTPIIITNAILIERKGHRQVFQQLSLINADFKYIVIGQYLPDAHHRSNEHEINEMKELYALGKNLLGSKIEFVNTVEDITPYLAHANLFLYGGVKDGTPNAVLEAMASGVPVLMYNAGENEDLFKPGYAVEMFNSFSEIPEKINALLSDKNKMKTIAENATQTISKFYTFEKVATRLFNTIHCINLKE